MKITTAYQFRRLTFWVYWRTFLTMLIVGPIAGFFFGFLSSFTASLVLSAIGEPKPSLDIFHIIGGVSGYLGSVIVGFFVLNFWLWRVVGKRIGDRQLSFDSVARE